MERCKDTDATRPFLLSSYEVSIAALGRIHGNWLSLVPRSCTAYTSLDHFTSRAMKKLDLTKV